MKTRLLLFVFFILIISGCGTKQISITKDVQNNIETLDIALYIPQNNIYVTVPSTNPGSAGLLGALIISGIDAIRRNSAEKEAALIIQEIQNYDFRSVFLNEIHEKIHDIDTLKINIPIKLYKIYSDSQTRIAHDQSKASAIMLMHVEYRLESGNLIIVSSMQMFPKSENLLSFREKANSSNPLNKGNAIYRKSFAFVKQSITEENIKSSLAEGSSSIAEQIADDLNHIQ